VTIRPKSGRSRISRKITFWNSTWNKLPYTYETQY